MNEAKRRGRPKLDNPKTNWLSMRLDDDEEAIISEHCERYQVTRPDAIRAAVRRLKEVNPLDEWYGELETYLSSLQSSSEQILSAMELIQRITSHNHTPKRSEEDEKK